MDVAIGVAAGENMAPTPTPVTVPLRGGSRALWRGGALWNLDLLESISKPLADAYISRRIFCSQFACFFLMFKNLIMK